MSEVDKVSKDTVKGEALHEVYNAVAPGVLNVASLRLAADVVSAETVTIGADVYEIEIVNTDSTKDLTTALTSVTEATLNITGHSVAAGALIRIENEIMKVVTVWDADNIEVLRGHSGTTAATHVATSDVYIGDGIDSASTLAVGLVATLTPTAAAPALVDVITEEGTEAITAVQISVNEILLKDDEVGQAAVALSEALGGANNTIETTTASGKDKGANFSMSVNRTPTAQEVAIGNLHVAVPFTPTEAYVKVRDSSNNIVAWDGAVGIDGTNNIVTIGNGGAVDWAADSTVSLEIVG